MIIRCPERGSCSFSSSIQCFWCTDPVDVAYLQVDQRIVCAVIALNGHGNKVGIDDLAALKGFIQSF